ncbi:MAG: hypothetical protein WKF43_09140 [Acidimicrobiales bacterium]
MLTATADSLYIGSDTTSLGGEYHARLGSFPQIGGTANPAPRPATLPTDLFVVHADGVLDRRPFTGVSFGTPIGISGSQIDGVDWSDVRGAFMVNGVLYTIHDDGTMKTWTWDGVRFVNPLDLAPWFSLANKTLLAYANGRIFYTTAGDATLYWRWFSIESGLLGSERFVADPGTGGANWHNAVGLTVAGGKMYTAHSTGNLTRTDLYIDGMPVPGTTVIVSGPAVGDGLDWNVVDLFVFSGGGAK